jgi:putative redox protein
MVKSERVEFQGSQGDRLAARLELPAGTPRAYAIFAHCFSCSKDIHAGSRIARRLAARGIAVLRFDFTGLGQSEGDFANTNFSSNVDDLVLAAEFLEREHAAPALLIGHSLGGAAVIVAAHRLPSVRAVAAVGAPADAAHVAHQFDAHLDEINETGEAEVSLAGRPFRIRKQFLEDIGEQKVEEAAATLKRPLLIAHSPIDATVGVENATRLFLAAKHPKSFVSLDQADHLLSDSDDAEHAADIIAAWADRYAADSDTPEPPRKAKGDGVVVRETGQGKFQNHVVVGDQVYLADEPASYGGTGTGPTPYQYLAAGLGACTVMTMRMYAEHKGWAVDRMGVELHHEKGHAEDCAACVDGQERKVDIIEKTITIEGELSEDQRQRLLEIADKCPVHRTLNSPVVIRTELAEPDLQAVK